MVEYIFTHLVISLPFIIILLATIDQFRTSVQNKKNKKD